MVKFPTLTSKVHTIIMGLSLLLSVVNVSGAGKEDVVVRPRLRTPVLRPLEVRSSASVRQSSTGRTVASSRTLEGQ